MSCRKYLNQDMEHSSEQVQSDKQKGMKLDDARRVKVLSPGMLVFKRFIRNKLAVVGFCILMFMFLFAFVGAIISPYGQTQVFTGDSEMSSDYATANYNTDMRYAVVEGETFSSGARTQFILATTKNSNIFKSENLEYYIYNEGTDFYRIARLEPVVEIMIGKPKYLNEEFKKTKLMDSVNAAIAAGESEVDFEGTAFIITQDKKKTVVSTETNIAMATKYIYDAYEPGDEGLVASYEFRYAAEKARAKNQKNFTVAGKRYSMKEDGNETLILDASGKEFALGSDIVIGTALNGVNLTIDFKRAAHDAVRNKQGQFVAVDDKGEQCEYKVNRVNTNYYITRVTFTQLIRMYESPSKEHWLGLDNNGMDLLTRLMYGGRVSLMVGFVVILIEMFIGVIIGGISGYFGGWVDTALMRFVDLFNSIPFYPMVIIAASVMDTLEVKPEARIFLLMIILGVLGWTGVARVVRGQILSLREQDFMVATEATGIRTGRRIFKHLVPNVMPLLIVQATAGLGGVIISEATLGFLGLGVKYPLASWGSIINVASDAHVMTSYWFMWLPAGMLILLTVLGFNFVGDGLRDAFDPKMKR